MSAALPRRPAPLVVLLFGAALGVLAGMVWAVLTPAASSATVFVGSSVVTTTPDLPRAADLAQQAARSYASVAVSDLVLDDVERTLGLHEPAAELARRVDVHQTAGTALLQITARDADAAQAARIANAIAARLSAVSSDLAPVAAGDVPSPSVVQVARASASDSSTAMLLIVLAGLLNGTAAGALVLAARRGGRRPPSGGALAAV